MHQFIKSPDDVLAVKLSGTISSKDLDAVTDRVEEILAKHKIIHVYTETHGIVGLELAALPHHFRRTLPLFGKLDRFGRIAVVADQAWMRASTRVESAIFPKISYRVFRPEERKEALDFAFGMEKVTV